MEGGEGIYLVRGLEVEVNKDFDVMLIKKFIE